MSANGARGLLVTAWGDNGHHQPWFTSTPPHHRSGRVPWAKSRRDQPAEIIDTLHSNKSKGQGTSICALGQIEGRSRNLTTDSFLNSASRERKTAKRHCPPLANQTELAKCEEALNAIPTDGLDPEIALSIRLNRAGLERCLNKTPPKAKFNWRKTLLHNGGHSREGGSK